MSDKERDEIHDTDEPTKEPYTGGAADPLPADDPEGGQTQGSGGGPNDPPSPPPQGGGN